MAVRSPITGGFRPNPVTDGLMSIAKSWHPQVRSNVPFLIGGTFERKGTPEWRHRSFNMANGGTTTTTQTTPFLP